MIIISGKVGQLGNRLFNFATFIAYAAEKNIAVINPSFDEYAKYFEITRKDLLCRFPPKQFPVSKLNENGSRRYFYKLTRNYLVPVLSRFNKGNKLVQLIALKTNEFFVLDDNPEASHSLKRAHITFVKGLHFRDTTNMRKHGDTIRSYFTPIQKHRDNVHKLIRRIRESCDVLIGIHIRAGDYAFHCNGRYYYKLEDYLNVMTRIQELFPYKKVSFLICSNEDLDPTKFSEFDFYFGNNHVIEDMYSFACCDYICGPPSTYSLWASFYGQVPIYFIQNPIEEITLQSFTGYFSLISRNKIFTDVDGSQYVIINFKKYRLTHKTDKEYLAL